MYLDLQLHEDVLSDFVAKAARDIAPPITAVGGLLLDRIQILGPAEAPAGWRCAMRQLGLAVFKQDRITLFQRVRLLLVSPNALGVRPYAAHNNWYDLVLPIELGFAVEGADALRITASIAHIHVPGDPDGATRQFFLRGIDLDKVLGPIDLVEAERNIGLLSEVDAAIRDNIKLEKLQLSRKVPIDLSALAAVGAAGTRVGGVRVALDPTHTSMVLRLTLTNGPCGDADDESFGALPPQPLWFGKKWSLSIDQCLFEQLVATEVRAEIAKMNRVRLTSPIGVGFANVIGTDDVPWQAVVARDPGLATAATPSPLVLRASFSLDVATAPLDCDVSTRVLARSYLFASASGLTLVGKSTTDPDEGDVIGCLYNTAAVVGAVLGMPVLPTATVSAAFGMVIGALLMIEDADTHAPPPDPATDLGDGWSVSKIPTSFPLGLVANDVSWEPIRRHITISGPFVAKQLAPTTMTLTAFPEDWWLTNPCDRESAWSARCKLLLDVGVGSANVGGVWLDDRGTSTVPSGPAANATDAGPPLVDLGTAPKYAVTLGTQPFALAVPTRPVWIDIVAADATRTYTPRTAFVSTSAGLLRIEVPVPRPVTPVDLARITVPHDDLRSICELIRGVTVPAAGLVIRWPTSDPPGSGPLAWWRLHVADRTFDGVRHVARLGDHELAFERRLSVVAAGSRELVLRTANAPESRVRVLRAVLTRRERIEIGEPIQQLSLWGRGARLDVRTASGTHRFDTGHTHLRRREWVPVRGPHEGDALIWMTPASAPTVARDVGLRRFEHGVDMVAYNHLAITIAESGTALEVFTVSDAKPERAPNVGVRIEEQQDHANGHTLEIADLRERMQRLTEEIARLEKITNGKPTNGSNGSTARVKLVEHGTGNGSMQGIAIRVVDGEPVGEPHPLQPRDGEVELAAGTWIFALQGARGEAQLVVDLHGGTHQLMDWKPDPQPLRRVFIPSADAEATKRRNELKQWLVETAPGVVVDGLAKVNATALGNATGELVATKDGLGKVKTFERGVVVVTPWSTTYVIAGPIFVKWRDLGGFAVVGYPVEPEQTVTRNMNGRKQSFRGATAATTDISTICWIADIGTYWIRARIWQLWFRLGSEASILGYPTSDPLSLPPMGGQPALYQTYSTALVCDTSMGVYALPWAFYLRWQQLGGMTATGPGILTSDHLTTADTAESYFHVTSTGGLGGGAVLYQWGVGGKVLWIPLETFLKWLELRDRGIDLGQPVTDWTAVGGGLRTEFQIGTITLFRSAPARLEVIKNGQPIEGQLPPPPRQTTTTPLMSLQGTFTGQLGEYGDMVYSGQYGPLSTNATVDAIVVPQLPANVKELRFLKPTFWTNGRKLADTVAVGSNQKLDKSLFASVGITRGGYLTVPQVVMVFVQDQLGVPGTLALGVQITVTT